MHFHNFLLPIASPLCIELESNFNYYLIFILDVGSTWLNWTMNNMRVMILLSTQLVSLIMIRLNFLTILTIIYSSISFKIYILFAMHAWFIQANFTDFYRSDIAWKDAKYAQIWEYLRDEFELTQRFASLDFKLKFV